MRIRWTYELAPVDLDTPLDSAPPLHWDGSAILLANTRFAHGREARVRDVAAHGCLLHLHRVAADGAGTVQSSRLDSTLTSSGWSFLGVDDELFLRPGSFHSVTRGEPLANLPFIDARYGAWRGIFCRHQDLLLCADLRTSVLHALDPKADREAWSLALPNQQGGAVGPIALRDGNLICWGADTLGTYDPATGERVDAFHLPGLGELEPPIAYDSDRVYVWSTAKKGGLVRVDPTSATIRWTFTKPGRIASTPGGLVVAGRTAVLGVHGGSTLVGVDVETGEERWRFRAQWLYTPLEVDGESIALRAPITTAPLVVGRDVYAFRWPKTPGKPGTPSLVALET